jgi:hypothetical protein
MEGIAGLFFHGYHAAVTKGRYTGFVSEKGEKISKQARGL